MNQIDSLLNTPYWIIDILRHRSLKTVRGSTLQSKTIS